MISSIPTREKAYPAMMNVACLYAALVSISTLSVAAGTAKADDFYKAKSLSIIVSYAPGGGYDTYARVFAAHVGKHIPGTPSTIVQNMPGASGIRAANHVATRAPRDGSVILAFSASAAFSPIFNTAGAQYQPTDFTWIGSFVQSTGTCSVWKTSSVQSFEDLLVREGIFGASGPAGLDSEYPRGMNAVMGTRARVIHGYNGTKSILLALQRGEVEGGCGFQLSSLLSAFKQHYDSGDLKPIVQFGLKSDKLPNVPHIMDFAKTEEDRQVFTLIFMRDVLGRPLAGPPGLPAERTKTLRAAFDATLQDPDYVKMAEKAKLTLDPRDGSGVETFVREFAAASPEAVARALKALEIGKVENVKLKSAAGTLAALGEKGRIELKDNDGKAIKATLSGKGSSVVIGGQKATPGELKTGMACTMSYLGEGDLVKTIACNP